jgi:FKBP-type peptidyl-prolyl cis-trans isomerase FklB
MERCGRLAGTIPRGQNKLNRKNVMKRIVIALLGVGLAAGALAADKDVVLKDAKDKLSYSLGYSYGRSLTNASIDIAPDPFAAGLRAILAGEKPLLTESEVTNIMVSFNNEMRAKYMERMKKTQTEQAEKSRQLADQNKKEGDAFLAANKQKEGVKTTEVKLANGTTAELQYKVHTTGTGPKPTTNDTVSVNYRGTLLNGTEFDSSYKRGEPANFEVTKVIRGWTEALLSMPVGSKWQLFIPSELAYGTNGTRAIPPGALLQFDMELVSAQPKPEKTPAKK